MHYYKAGVLLFYKTVNVYCSNFHLIIVKVQK